MAGADDKVLTASEVFHDLIRAGDALAAAPLNPCPRCGAETKEHHTPEGSRICSSPTCRARVSDPRVLAAMREMGQQLQPVVVACPECGAVTKVHHTPEGSRICVGARNVTRDANGFETVTIGERHVLQPGTFEDPDAGVDRGEWRPDPNAPVEAPQDGGEVTFEEMQAMRGLVAATPTGVEVELTPPQEAPRGRR